MTLARKILQIVDILGFHNLEMLACIRQISFFRTKTGFRLFADPTYFGSATVLLRVAVGRLKVSSIWLGSFFLAQAVQLECFLPVVLEMLRVLGCTV